MDHPAAEQCSNCGQPLRKFGRFCARCGKRREWRLKNHLALNVLIVIAILAILAVISVG